MTPRATISAVITTFNSERYIAAAIESVLGQTLPPDEIIVVEDGSTDGTRAVLNGYGDRLTVIAQSNRGIGSANNRGVAASGGAFFCFLDADDLWLRDKLEKQMAWMTAHPQTEAVFGYVQQFVSEDLDEKDKQRLVCPPEPQPGISKQTLLIRQPAFERIGPFHESLRHGEFVDWYSRALDQGLRSHMLPDVVTLRRLHATNAGILERDNQRLANTTVLKRALDRRRRREQRSIDLSQPGILDGPAIPEATIKKPSP
jgi:glycosyltransferase involved in cell wall biosynthesis